MYSNETARMARKFSWMTFSVINQFYISFFCKIIRSENGAEGWSTANYTGPDRNPLTCK